jgi:SAM-dependent methyltransferase
MFDQLKIFAIDTAVRIMRRGAIVNEHFVPTLGLELAPYLAKGDRTAVHHLLHYDWAVKVVGDLATKNLILDVACGAGYGSYLLARAFPTAQVLGVDYDRTAIQYANKHYSLPNLQFKIGDTLLWQKTIGATSFDCIVSFETLEHCKHREIMLENLVAHLNPQGCLLLSTPCGWDENVLHPRWPHHAIEYSSASLYDFLSRYFAQIRRPDGPDFPHLEVFDCLNGTGIVYNLRLNPVVCSLPIRIDNPYR